MHTDKLKYAVYFHGSLIGTTGQRIVEGKVLLELEAVRCLDSVHEAQLSGGSTHDNGNEPTFKQLIYNKSV
jgi:hypothetical protein